MSEHNEVLKTINTMTRALADGDLDAILSTYSKDAVVMGDSNNPIKGKEALKSMFAELLGNCEDFRYGAHDVVTVGNTALHLMKWTAPDPSGALSSALSIAVLHQEKDGRWKILIDHPFGDSVMQQN